MRQGTKKCSPWKIAGLIGLVSTLLYTQVVAQEPAAGMLDKKWHVKLYEKNSDYIKVAIDASSLEWNAYEVSIEVIFFDKAKHPIDKRSFQFTDATFPVLVRNDAVYVRYFPHHISFPKSVKGSRIHYSLSPPGKTASGVPIVTAVLIAGGSSETYILFFIPLSFLKRIFHVFRVHRSKQRVILGSVPESRTSKP